MTTFSGRIAVGNSRPILDRMLDAIGIVSGPNNAEDLVLVPGTPWVLTSGMAHDHGPGQLYAIDTRDMSASEILPHSITHSLDRDRFADVPELDPLRFQPHGLDVAVRRDGVAELYVVGHGQRESIEVFEIDLDDRRPALRWVGAAELPEGQTGNDVAAAGDCRFIVSTNAIDPEAVPKGRVRPFSGRAWEWQGPGSWVPIAGTDINSANGIAVSPLDGTVFIAGWRSRCLKRVRRDPGATTTVIETGILTDNLTWDDDGSLLAAGPSGVSAEEYVAANYGPEPRRAVPTRVLRIDPTDLAVEVLVEYGPETFSTGTTGTRVGDELWIGTSHGSGLVRFAG